MLEVDVDGRCLGQLGPGAIVGERAAVEGGLRTATLRAVTDCRVAVVIADQIDPPAVSRLSYTAGRSALTAFTRPSLELARAAFTRAERAMTKSASRTDR